LVRCDDLPDEVERTFLSRDGAASPLCVVEAYRSCWLESENIIVNFIMIKLVYSILSLIECRPIHGPLHLQTFVRSDAQQLQLLDDDGPDRRYPETCRHRVVEFDRIHRAGMLYLTRAPERQCSENLECNCISRFLAGQNRCLLRI
jgi:hypothetical protein